MRDVCFILVERDSDGMLHAVERKYDRISMYLNNANECDISELEENQPELIDAVMDHWELIGIEPKTALDDLFDFPEIELSFTRMFRITDDAYIAIFTM